MQKRYLNINIIFILFISIILSSCWLNEKKIESDAIKEFDKSKVQMQDVIDYVRANYYSMNSIENINQLQFILSDIAYQKGTIFCDVEVTKKLKNTNIYDISFEKNSLCLDKFTFDIVRFKLKIKNSNYQYYYVYEFCPLNFDNVDNKNFKSVNLGNN